MEDASAISGARGASTQTNSQLQGPTTHRAAGAGGTPGIIEPRPREPHGQIATTYHDRDPRTPRRSQQPALSL
eukprot:7185873-Prymnesium_polylepis.1